MSEPTTATAVTAKPEQPVPTEIENEASTTEAQDPGIGTWQRFSLSCVRMFLRVHLAVWGRRGLYASCRLFGTIEYLINYKRRRKVGRMIDTALCGKASRAEVRGYTRAHFMRQRCDKAFYLIGDLLTTEQLKACFTITNRHLLDDGYARGKGIYALTSHHGNYHITGLTMSALGYRVGAIRDPNESPMRRYIQARWARMHPDLPQPQVLYSGDFARQIYRLLKDNYGLGSSLDIARDREARLKKMMVNVYGGQREFLTGTLQIALRCKATVVQVFMVAHDNFSYELKVLGPFTNPDVDKETPELLQSILQRYADNIQEHSSAFPDQIMRA